MAHLQQQAAGLQRDGAALQLGSVAGKAGGADGHDRGVGPRRAARAAALEVVQAYVDGAATLHSV